MPTQQPIPLIPLPQEQLPVDPNEVPDADEPANGGAAPVGPPPDDDDMLVPEGVDDSEIPPVDAHEPMEEAKTDDDDDEDEDDQYTKNLSRLRELTPARSGRRRFLPGRLQDAAGTNVAEYVAKNKLKFGVLNQGAFIASLQFKTLVDAIKTNEFAKMWSLTTDYNYEDSTCELLHPMILAAKANSEDNPNWEQAMNGPLKKGYWEAAVKEIETLQEMDVWDVVPKTSKMNVLPSTWAFKCKRFPDGTVRKLKGRFCVRGDRQKDGVDFDSDDIYAPVVSWQTVRLLLILSLVLGLETKQVDYTAAITHAPIGDKEVYCDMPQGFKKDRHVLKLKKSLYGLCQSPRNF